MPRIIRKYSNRKMYDTETSRLITLSGVAALIGKGEDIKVIDNQTGNDLTTLTLAQIILEQEKSKKELLSLPRFLNEIIKRGRDSLSEVIEKALLGLTESVFLTEERTGQAVRCLIERKRSRKPEIQRSLKRVFLKANERRAAFQSQIETLIKQVLTKMDSLSQRELQELENNLQKLLSETEALIKLKPE